MPVKFVSITAALEVPYCVLNLSSSTILPYLVNAIVAALMQKNEAAKATEEFVEVDIDQVVVPPGKLGVHRCCSV